MYCCLVICKIFFCPEFLDIPDNAGKIMRRRRRRTQAIPNAFHANAKNIGNNKTRCIQEGNLIWTMEKVIRCSFNIFTTMIYWIKSFLKTVLKSVFTKVVINILRIYHFAIFFVNLFHSTTAEREKENLKKIYLILTEGTFSTYLVKYDQLDTRILNLKDLK